MLRRPLLEGYVEPLPRKDAPRHVRAPTPSRAPPEIPLPPSPSARFGRTCAAQGCDRSIPKRLLMCWEHWKLVPEKVRKEAEAGSFTALRRAQQIVLQWEAAGAGE